MSDETVYLGPRCLACERIRAEATHDPRKIHTWGEGRMKLEHGGIMEWHVIDGERHTPVWSS